MQDCISAVATPAGTGGIAVIRLSGEGAARIARSMFRPAMKDCPYTHATMYFGQIEGDGFTDYGYLVIFYAPRSFTGEEVAELHCHGGAYIARGILSKTLSLGARAAERGEFTRRAFINGKLTLSSAEGMIDMINAESLALVRAGAMMYSEKLSGEVRRIQDGLTDTLARVAVEIDYPEEDSDGVDMDRIRSDVRLFHDGIAALAASYGCGRKIKSGVSVAICGKPNVGKSSLLNALLGYDKAIVSEEAGTTRDVVEGSIEIEGLTFHFTDTAGIREGAGAVEKMGIERAKNAMRTADIVLFVTDSGDEAPAESGGALITVFNKCDKITPRGKYDAAVSAKTGEGLPALKAGLLRLAAGDYSLDKSFVVEERHYRALLRAEEALGSALSHMETLTADLISVDLREAWDALGEITGETASEAIVDAVFSRFCVGK